MAYIYLFITKLFLLCLLFLYSAKSYILNTNNNIQNIQQLFQNENIDIRRNSNMMEKCNVCVSPAVCVPFIQCATHLNMPPSNKPDICDLPGDERGYCCIKAQNNTLKIRFKKINKISNISMDVLENAKIQLNNIMTEKPLERTSNSDAMEETLMLQILTKDGQLTVEDVVAWNSRATAVHNAFQTNCQTSRDCLNLQAPYRSISGSCNNAHIQHWGAAGQPIERILPPVYNDGIWAPRSFSASGRLLQSAREISRATLVDVHRPHPKHSLLLMQFGQFISHDIIRTSTIKLQNGEALSCCTADGKNMLNNPHFACLPITVKPTDEFYGRFGIRCMDFVRLSLTKGLDCGFSYAKQKNEVTHFLDGSAIYGSNQESANQLRSFHGGQLLMSHNFGRELLPLTQTDSTCNGANSPNVCFKSGDDRTNQIISLTALHTLFAREHNRVANILAKINPKLSDELLYQEARRIVVAELQHITYNEYLPLIIGKQRMKRFRILVKGQGYSQDYDQQINPAVTAEFAGAAYRMGHSSVDGKFRMHGRNNFANEAIPISDVMLNPARMAEVGFFDNLMLTLLRQPMQMVDNSVTHGLTRFLFRNGNNVGLDLAAINIQRGRDLALHPYNDYLQLIGLERITSFNDFPKQFAVKLRSVYDSPHDIDLWIGGLLEKPVEGGIVGPTFAEIIADQFSRTKNGDRYFYENDAAINPGAFNLKQLNEIRKVTMGRLICNNMNNANSLKVQLFAFSRDDSITNPLIDCNNRQLGDIDFTAWKIQSV